MDDAGYVDLYLNGCHQSGIPVEGSASNRCCKLNSLLNPEIQRCFRVPDASADSFLASELNVASAENYGASVRNYLEVKDLIRLVTGLPE
jgi:glycerol-3-phosphate dehydrogenase